MASLMENLIDVLNLQYDEYVKLLEFSKEKTSVIIKGDLEELTKLTDDEQAAVAVVVNLDRKREEIMKDIANVINKDYNTLKLSDLVTMLANRPEEQAKLSSVRDKLREIALSMKTVNERNGELLKMD